MRHGTEWNRPRMDRDQERGGRQPTGAGRGGQRRGDWRGGQYQDGERRGPDSSRQSRDERMGRGSREWNEVGYDEVDYDLQRGWGHEAQQRWDDDGGQQFRSSGGPSSRRPETAVPNWSGQGGGEYDQEGQFARRGGYGHPGTRGGAQNGGRNPREGQSFRGKGPQSYRRSDERIREEVCEALTDDANVDATRIEVRVESGDVVLSGLVDDRATKRMAEDLAEAISGVRDVRNELQVQRPSES